VQQKTEQINRNSYQLGGCCSFSMNS